MRLRNMVLARELSDEEAYLEYLEKLRWPKGVKCTKCGKKKISRITSRGTTGKPRHLYQCLVCRTQFTIRTGTILQDSYLPLKKWFKAISLVLQGTNVATLQREIDVQYRTAEYLMSRIHDARSRGERLEV